MYLKLYQLYKVVVSRKVILIKVNVHSRSFQVIPEVWLCIFLRKGWSKNRSLTKVRMWPICLQNTLSIFLAEEKCQVNMQGISLKFLSYQRRIRKVLVWSHFNHKFFSCKVFCQMCFKRSGRCEYTAQIPPLLGFSCLQSIQGSDYIFKLKTCSQGPALVFSLDAIVTV